MTDKGLVSLMRTMEAAYPNFHPSDPEGTLTIWGRMFEEYNDEEVALALKRFIMTDNSGFPPSIGQIVNQMATRETQQLEPLAAWALVYKAICNSGYNSESEFEKLPEACRIAVGSPANLREMAMMDVKTVNSVEQSHFLRSYDAAVKRMKEYARLPESLRIGFNGGRVATIEVNNNKLLEAVE